MISKITSKSKIQNWMRNYPELRSNKYKLVAYVLFAGLPEKLQTDEVKELLEIISTGYPIPIETILREYRHAFHDNPIWQDDDFYKRQAEAEEWKKEFIKRVYGVEQGELFK